VPPNTTDNIEFTPAGTSDAQILTVNAQETVQYDVRLNGWARSVNQPVPMDLIGPEERTDAGAYCVSGSDGLPVSAKQWTETGGSVTIPLSCVSQSPDQKPTRSSHRTGRLTDSHRTA